MYSLTRRTAGGFTIVELIVAITIAAVLAAVAVPSFSSLIANQRAKTEASELFASLLKTRSEAIKRNANVTVSPLPGGWAFGWQILDPVNPANVLENHGAAAGVTIVGPAAVTFRASGRVLGNALAPFQITTMAGSTTIDQCVSLDLSGRPYMLAAATC